MKLRKSLFAAAIVGLMGATLQAQAADEKGNYILRGMGANSCESYLAALQAGPQQVTPYISWMEGYISAVNRMQLNTYDASPVVAAAPMAAMVRNICQADPNLKFETATARLLNFLSPYRTPEESQLVEVTVGDSTAAVRAYTLNWMQEKLIAEKYLKGSPTGVVDKDTRTALGKYQKDRKLPESSVPDSATLVKMIQEDVEAKAKK